MSDQTAPCLDKSDLYRLLAGNLEKSSPEAKLIEEITKDEKFQRAVSKNYFPQGRVKITRSNGTIEYHPQAWIDIVKRDATEGNLIRSGWVIGTTNTLTEYLEEQMKSSPEVAKQVFKKLFPEELEREPTRMPEPTSLSSQTSTMESSSHHRMPTEQAIGASTASVPSHPWISESMHVGPDLVHSTYALRPALETPPAPRPVFQEDSYEEAQAKLLKAQEAMKNQGMELQLCTKAAFDPKHNKEFPNKCANGFHSLIPHLIAMLNVRNPDPETSRISQSEFVNRYLCVDWLNGRACKADCKGNSTRCHSRPLLKKLVQTQWDRAPTEVKVLLKNLSWNQNKFGDVQLAPFAVLQQRYKPHQPGYFEREIQELKDRKINNEESRKRNVDTEGFKIVGRPMGYAALLDPESEPVNDRGEPRKHDVYDLFSYLKADVPAPSRSGPERIAKEEAMDREDDYFDESANPEPASDQDAKDSVE